MDHSISTFLSGCARYHDFIFFAKSLDELEEQEQPNSTFLMIDGAAIGRVGSSVGWAALSLAVTKNADRLVVCALGPNGELWEGSPADGTSVTGEIGIGEHAWRSLAVVGGQVFACGMDRTVAVRTGQLRWENISAPSSQDSGVVVGFEGIDGFSSGEIYAVGWQGEIWRRNGETWSQIDSPASATLNSVCCAEDGVVYAVGDNGLLLKGRNDQWVNVPTGQTANLQDVRDFGGKVYAVTDFDIFEITEEGLEQVAVDEDDEPGTCLHLAKAEDGLISIGQKDVLKLHNGKWRRVV